MVIRQFTDHGFHHFPGRIDAGDAHQPEMKIVVFVKQFTEWLGNGIGFEARRGHLIQQRPEAVVILLVEHNHLKPLAPQAFNQIDPAKSPTNHHHTGLVGVGNVERQFIEMQHVFFC